MGRPWWGDEYWKKLDWRRERRMRTTCPHCGSDRTYYNERYKSWKCLRCEKSFVVEDLAPTKDSRLVRRISSPPKDEIVEHYERMQQATGSGRRRPPISARISRFRRPRRFPWRELLLLFLIAVGIAIIAYSINLLLDHRVNTGIAIAVIVANIIVVIWNASILTKRYRRLRPRRVIGTLVAFALIGSVLFAFAGVAPFSSAKDTVISWFSTNQGPSGGLPQATPTPTPPTYPAAISGDVTIAERVIVERYDGETEYLPSGQRNVLWIVDISVQNNAYENDVKWYYEYWKIVFSDTVYTSAPFPSFSPTTTSVPPHQSGESKYLFTVPGDLSVSDATLCYQGDAPHSYGSLSGGTSIETYEWKPTEYVYKPQGGYKELYVIAGFLKSDRYLELTTVKAWRGSSSRRIDYHLDRAPAVVNYGYTQTSRIGKAFEVRAIMEVRDPQKLALIQTWYGWAAAWGILTWQEDSKWFVSWPGYEAVTGPLEGVGCIQLADPGKITISVEASGVDWWVKVGVE